MSLASPVGKDGFYYNGSNLYVEVGSGNRHARASIAQLNDLLRPNSKQSKAAAAAAQPIQDKVGHWWEAQLTHYGLAASKNKSVCKVRLLDALNHNILNVPDPIRKIEDALKKEFNAKERRAKAEYKASIAANKPVVPNNNNKRKHEDSPVAAINNFSNCNIILGHNGTFSQPSSSINGTQPAAKRVKKPAPDPAHSSPKSSKVRGVSGSKSTDSLSAPLPILKSKKSSTETGTAAKNDLKLQIDSKAKKELKTKYESKDKSEPKAKPEVKPKGKAKKETIIKSESKVKREPNVKKEPKVKAENKVKSERAIKTEDLSSPVQSTFSPIPSPTSSCPSLGLLNGIYDLQSAAMSPDASMTLAVDGSQLWGAFNFGQSFGGLISFPRRPYRASNEPLSCQWRSYPRDGRTMGSGRVSFMGDGHIHGSFHGGAVQFQGCRRQGPAYTPRPPASYQEEWEYIHDINDGDGDNGQYESSDEDSAQFEDSMDGIKYYD